jgi:hypothetical protein
VIPVILDNVYVLSVAVRGGKPQRKAECVSMLARIGVVVVTAVLALVTPAGAEPGQRPDPPEAVREEVAKSLAVAAGGSQAWPLAIKRVLIKTVSTYRDDPPSESTKETFLEVVGPGLIRARTTDTADGSATEATSVYGFLEAATWVRSGNHSMRRIVTDFFADAQISALAPGTAFSLQQKVLMVEDEKRWSTSLYRSACKVGPTASASSLHRRLAGAALAIDCSSTVDGRPANRSKGFLLPSSGWYFQESFETSFYKARSRLLEVELF